jgi:hypothetical protein
MEKFTDVEAAVAFLTDSARYSRRAGDAAWRHRATVKGPLDARVRARRDEA